MSTATKTAPKPIDSRGPRYVGGFTFFIAVAILILGLVRPIEPTVLERAISPEFILTAILWLSFGAGTFFGNGAHPFAAFFRAVILPRLKPGEKEDPRPPRFALLIGFSLTTVALVLHLAGVPYGLVVAIGLVVVASFLQAFVGLCLGCQVYLLLVRAGVIRPSTPLLA